MARIAGVNIPQDKVVHVALTYIYGIGNFNSKVICEKLNIPLDQFNVEEGSGISRKNRLTPDAVKSILKAL